MSVIPMKRLTLVGLRSEQDTLLNGLSKLGCTHIVSADGIEFTKKHDDSTQLEAIAEKMAATERSMNFIAQCLEIKQAELKSQGDKTKVTVKLHGPRFEVKYDDFAQTNRDEYALFGRVIDTCERLSHRLSDIEKRRAELNKEIEALKFYKNLDIRFSEVKDTTNTIMVLGYIPEVQEDTTEKLINACPSVAFEFSKGSTLMVFAVALKEDKNELMSQLNSYGFVPCPYNDNLDYKEKIDKINIELNELDTEVSEIRSRAIEFREYVPQLKVLYDFYSLNYQRVNTNEEIFYTDETYVLKAWYPEEKEEKLLKLIDKLTTAVAVETEAPDMSKGDLPPTKLKNNKFAAPFEFVTNMYSVPNYWENDPNRFVGIWFTFLFGMMLGDVGYGLILVILGFALVRLMKPEKDMKNLMLVLAYGGFSTIFWGIMYGGWFSIDWFSEHPLFIAPLDNPMAMMGLSIGIGMLHMSTAFVLKAEALFKEKKYADAILGQLVWIPVFVGIALMLLSFFGGVEGVMDIGLYIFMGCLVLIFINGAMHKKGIIGKIIGGFGGLYGIINIMSDSLSYLRLFGLGLATGIIGWVFNMLAGMIMTNAIGYIFGILILIAGHALNLAINVLGTFIHDMRLQHVEFFGKFYTGEGYEFTPFARNTKYVRLRDED